MIEIQHKSYFPLVNREIDNHVPSQPGVCVLAVRLASGVHKPIHSIQSDNLYGSLKQLTRKTPSDFPPYVLEAMKQFQCYFTFFVADSPSYTNHLSNVMNELLFTA